jgi:DNA ligase-1
MDNPMLLERLVATSRAVATTRSRLSKVAELGRCLGELAPEEVEAGIAFLYGEPRQGKVGVGYATLRDLGVAAPAAQPTLGVLDLDAQLDRIQRTNGPGSAAERKRLLGETLTRATAEEQAFIIRLLSGELRQGALEGIMVEAVARASRLPLASVRRAVMLAGSVTRVGRAALEQGETGLQRYKLELFRPVHPMLADSAEDIDDALGRLGRAALEYKLDGARIQVHKQVGDVRVFTRNLNDVTDAVPEVVETVRALRGRELVLDGEALALDEHGRPRPFQVTMRRFGRRLEVEKLRSELPLTPFFFDCLYRDGQELIDQPTDDRVRALTEVVPPAHLIARRVTDSVEQARGFLASSLAAGHEGVMVKALGSAYEAGRRGGSWLKVKRAHTLDLVVLAVEWGSGRRSGWLSNLHLGARDPRTQGFVMLGKTFKGMTDEMLRWQTNKLRELALGQEGHVLHVRPELVVEVMFDGIQSSPHYDSGLALRFARIKRYRVDKSAAEADTIDTVRALFARERGVGESR